MKNSLLFAFLVASIPLFSQITVTSSDFPEGGDTVLVSVSSDFEYDFVSSGADYDWNYDALNMTDQRIDTFFDIDDADILYQIIFNNGWFDPDYQADYFTPLLNFAFPETDAVPIGNPVGFTKIETDKVEIIGVGLEISGIKVPIKNEIIDVEYELPMSYGDEWESTSFFEVDLNPAFDGILRRHQERTSEVDGWGEVTTPFGTFEVVRTKSFLDFTDSLRISFGEITTWIELPTPSQVVYSWWAEDQKIPVLQVVAQDIGGTETITSVEYKDRDLSDVGIAESPTNQPNITLFPVPSADFINIISESEIQNIQIYSLTGAISMQDIWTKKSGILNVSQLAPGSYIVLITQADGVYTEQIIIE
ncbi:MAG: T9SS type A sorting domain-containing protein [Crocinitomix sp.]|nr:T9SS type A sorting domain-containing protein [Crocinitomix sp.]